MRERKKWERAIETARVFGTVMISIMVGMMMVSATVILVRIAVSGW
jgi:hypothetical protein